MKPPNRSPSSISSSWLRAQRLDAPVATTAARTGTPSWLAPGGRLARPSAPQAVLPEHRKPSLAAPAVVIPSRAPTRSISDPTMARVTPLPAVPADLVAEAAVAADDERLGNLQAEITELRAQLADAEAALPRVRAEVMAASEGELVRLAIAIARRVVARELRTEPALVARWAHEALAQLATGDAEAAIAAAPDVLRDVPPEAWRAALGDGTEVHSHSTMPPGGCEVRAGAATIAVGVDARFDAVAHELEEQLA